MKYCDEPLYSGIKIGGEVCYSFHTGDSHGDIVHGAGCTYFSFKDPRPRHEGERLRVDRYYINDAQTKIKGVNLYDRNGNFACSYFGEDYESIVQKNIEDSRMNLQYSNEQQVFSNQNCQQQGQGRGVKR